MGSPDPEQWAVMPCEEAEDTRPQEGRRRLDPARMARNQLRPEHLRPPYNQAIMDIIVMGMHCVIIRELVM